MIKRYTVIFIMLVLVSAIAIPHYAHAAPQHGIVPVPIKNRAGEEVGLYKESHALVIGVSQYTTAGWPILPGVKKDVKLVKAALEKHGFNVVTVMDPDLNEMRTAFNDFIFKYGDEVNNRLIFYFAGHGHTLKLSSGAEMGYIVPKDAPNPNRDKRGFRSKAMDMEMIEVFAKRIESKHALFLFDSCFSGSIFALERAHPKNITYKTNRPVRQFITAGSADETVPDESIFRQQFIEALEGEGDTDEDGYLTGVELGEFLQKNVVNYSQGSQHPQYGKISNPHLDKGDFVFPLQTAKLATPTPSPTPSPSPAPSFVPEPAPVILQGHLQVNVNAPVTVQIDGEQKGTASPGNPLSLRDLNTGTVTVRLEAEGYLPMKKTVSIQRNQWTQEVFELKRERVVRLETKKAPPKPEPGVLPGMVNIPAGVFTAGLEPSKAFGECQKYSNICNQGWYSDEGPVHTVSLRSFNMDKYEVTQKEFERVMGKNPSYFKGSNRPVEGVSWYEAKQYCYKMGKRLPTEAEWEKAAKGGRNTMYPWGNEVGVNNANCSNCGSHWDLEETAPIGSFKPNGYGLYDMAGNVFEWVSDWYYEGAYRTASRNDPQGPFIGSMKIVRGGSWNQNPDYMRTAYRSRFEPDKRSYNRGFRCAK
jgi:formylglycine-generating enzyme required for sulfatase activity